MPIRYDITRLLDGKYKASRLSISGKITPVPASFTRSELEIFLKDSVSKTRLEQALPNARRHWARHSRSGLRDGV